MAMRDFRSALNLLGDDQREAIILVGASGFSYDEAAEIVGVAPGTIKSRVSRARKTLGELMGETEVTIGQDDEAIKAAAGTGIDRAAQAV